MVRTQASTDAGVGARSDRGCALSPTASVMKDTWMKSDSQLSTYMNHMAPPSRPALDCRRDGPARSGSGDTEPPPLLPRPRPADGPTTVRRRRENPGPRAASGRVWTSAARRRGGPTAAVPRGVRARAPPNSRGWLHGGDSRRGKPEGPEGRDAAPVQEFRRQPLAPSCALPRQPGVGSRAGGGRHDPSPATSGGPSLRAGCPQGFLLLPLVKRTKLLSA